MLITCLVMCTSFYLIYAWCNYCFQMHFSIFWLGGHVFYCNFSSIFFICRLPSESELAEWNSIKTGHMFGSESNLKMRVQNLRYPPKNWGPGNHLWCFSMTSQLNVNFSRLCLRNETRYRQLCKCIWNYKGSPTSSENVMNCRPQTACYGCVLLLMLFLVREMTNLGRIRTQIFFRSWHSTTSCWYQTTLLLLCILRLIFYADWFYFFRF